MSIIIEDYNKVKKAITIISKNSNSSSLYITYSGDVFLVKDESYVHLFDENINNGSNIICYAKDKGEDCFYTLIRSGTCWHSMTFKSIKKLNERTIVKYLDIILTGEVR